MEIKIYKILQTSQYFLYMITLIPHTLSATSNAVVMEGNEAPNGWPLGLGNMNTVVVAPPQPAASRLRRCSSFSSFSSSNLDTESTASFFPDQSVPLGKLIGIRTIGGNKQCENETSRSRSRHHTGVGGPSPQCRGGICTSLLHQVFGRIFRRPKHLHTIVSQ